ncbi:MAG: hypothetical protein K1X67_12635 [Fimbriimonadaceae bacterium]|nr:hypothetical protein [Fimbriimonadaceae bacterium]
MATNDPVNRTLGDRLQSLSRHTVYLCLIVVVSASVLASYFFKIVLPVKSTGPSQDFFDALMAVPEGSTVFVQSDFTNSTRGESAGQFQALLRILMRRKIKFALFCGSGEPQAVQVAKDYVAMINAERKAAGQPEYRRWDDYVALGLFTDGRAYAKALQADIRTAIENRKDNPPGEPPQDVWESPVLKDIKTLDDIALYINITGSKTTDILVERLKFKPVKFGEVEIKSKIGSMVTGVMYPEAQNYYKSGQVFGLVGGLNGNVEIEKMMEEKFKGEKNLASSTAYYFALHTAMALLIIFVILGNLGMYLSKKEGGAR